MGGRKRLALFVGQPEEDFQRRFIEGFAKKAFEFGMDVCVFSMFKKYQDTASREKGDSNIFTLANPDFFDGIVILKDTIQSEDAAEELEQRIKDTYDKPVLVVDKESKYFKSVYINGYDPMVQLTNHLIEDHGVKDIAFLAGKSWHRHSNERLSAFLESMRSHKLNVTDDRIIEGDFWYTSGEQCLLSLINSNKPLPEAIICANDQMAIGLCKALTDRGYRVPEDILIVGADSLIEGQTSPRSLTSYLSPASELGAFSVECLFDLKAKRLLRKFEGKSRVLFGESCGCFNKNMPTYNLKRDEWDTDISSEGFESVNNTMFENLLLQTNINDYISSVYSYAYQIKDADCFHLCLVSSLKYLNQNEVYIPKNEGYPKKMVHAIRYNRNNLDNLVSMDDTFETSEMLPDIYVRKDEPYIYYFNPVFFEDRCFGYAVVGFCNKPKTYDENYRRWINLVSGGLEVLRRHSTMDMVKEQIYKLRTGKFMKTSEVYENLSTDDKKKYETVKDILDNNLLKYYFQPIVSAVDGSIYSYEALMRSTTREPIPPLVILKFAGMMDRLSDVETATFRNVLDIIEKSKQKINGAKIFINSIPGISVKDIDELEKNLSKYCDTVVVELTEEAELSEEELENLKEFYERNNIEIAIDDYGTGYSNISNLLRYVPNYVKIDRSLLSDIQNKPQKEHFVREIINFCHDNGIKALAEGVETSEEMRTVIHLGVDLIQGYYTAKPAENFLEQIDEKKISEIKSYHQERSDGKVKSIYVAGKTNRISLLNLSNDGCTDIVIGREGMVYNDVTIVGMPSHKTDIHIRIEPRYSGRVTLENVYLSNVKNRPCIEVGEHAELVLVIEGDNILDNAGIMVPESSKFTLEGNGNMTITLNSKDYFGIGNDMKSRHGELRFLHSGKLNIYGYGTNGVGIGSGLGGVIKIKGGQFGITLNGIKSVGVGNLEGHTDCLVKSCAFEAELSVSKGVGIGSLTKDALVRVEKTSVKINGDAKEFVGMGTLGGEVGEVFITDSYAEFNIRSENSTCMGAYNASSKIDIEIASLRAESVGKEALIFGGINGDTEVSLISVDTRIELHNAIGKDSMIEDDKFKIVNGKFKVMVNGERIERELIYKF